MSGPGLVSVLVPVRERPEPLAELYREYAEPLRDAGLPFEFVVICEPWFETLGTPLLELAERGEPITVLQLGQGVGEATMLKVAGAKARGDVLVTLPAYRRVQAAVLVDLVAATREADLALAVRWPRRDSWINRVQNRWFHRLVRWFTGSHFRDLACGVRALRRRVLEETPLYGDFFRFLPLLAQREGFHVVELEAEQHQGDNQPRVYSPGIYLRRLIDLLGMFFLLRFTEKPLRFFGLVGSISALLGAAVLGVVSVQRLQGEPLADRPVLLLGVLLLVLGAQAVALGLVGEMIVFHHAHQRRRYRLAENVRELTADRALPSADERSGRAVGADDEDGPSGGSPAAGSAATPPSAGSGAGEPAPPGDRGAVRSSWTTWARLAIGVGLLGVLLSRVDLSQRTIRIGAEVVLGVGVTGALLLLAQAVSALRWKEILGAQAPAWGFLFRLYLIGNFFSLFLPTSVGGDAVRAVAASRALPARAAAVTSVVVDRLIGVAALLAYLALGVVAAPAVIARAGAAAEWRVPWLPVAAAVVVSLLVAVALLRRLVRSDAVLRRFGPALELVRRLRRSPGELARIAALGLVVQGLYIVAWALLATALGLRLPPALFLAAVPVVSLLAMLPVSLSGIGVREGAWLLLLAPFGVAAADAVAYSLVFFIGFALVGAIGGVVYSMMGTSLRGVRAEVT